MVDEKEQTSNEEENASEENQETALTDAEENVSETTEETEEKSEEGVEEEKPELKYSEADITTARDEERTKGQSIKDKELSPLYEQLETARKENVELNNRLDDKANEVLFASETESHGEDKAVSAKEARERMLKRNQELSENIQKHDFLKLYKDTDGKILSKYEEGLAERERGLKARDYGYEYFPESDAKTSKIREDFIKELVESDASSPKELESIAKVRSMEIKSKSPNKHKPAETKVKAAGTVDLSQLPIPERVNALFKIGEEKRKKK